MNYSDRIYRILETELGDVGRFVLEKQCQDLNINPHKITPENLPRLSRILSGVMSRFGEDKARRVSMAINNLRACEVEEEVEEETGTCPKCKAPVQKGLKHCHSCGQKVSEQEAFLKLFSDQGASLEKKQGNIAITDISERMAKGK